MSHRHPLMVRDIFAMSTWTAETHVPGTPEAVLALLTDPEAISRWAPIPFAVVGHHRRLAQGEQIRVKGWLAGRCLEFDVHVREADARRLRLTASGPIRMDVEY